MKYLDGKTYERDLSINNRKKEGVYYTPDFIVDYILKDLIHEKHIIDNPLIKVVDISCGTGNFLLGLYDYLHRIFQDNLEVLRDKYKEHIYYIEKASSTEKIRGLDYWHKDNIHYHILKHCIYGADKDSIGISILEKDLDNKSMASRPQNLNLISCDSLIRWEEDTNIENKDLNNFWSNKFDYVLGNPPYIGHKTLDMEYKDWLLKEYSQVFKDKSDISFCFFMRAMEVLKDGGKVGFISSRYFMESPTGESLRKFLKDKTRLIKLVDFYGASVFKDADVGTSLYFIENSQNIHKKIEVYKYKGQGQSLSDLNQSLARNFDHFYIDQEDLQDKRWILLSKEKKKILDKILCKGQISLRDMGKSFQGIISGCDKAFILDRKQVDHYKIDPSLVKIWLKNKNIRKYTIEASDLRIIYSNLIDDPRAYPSTISYIENHREKLESRREYKSGRISWYHLQWARKPENFECEKIIFPYKSASNRFALDKEGYYFSADIYGYTINDDYLNKTSYAYILGLLNSKAYEFYFKSFGKNLGNGIYDYYPNSVLDLQVFFDYKNNIIEKNSYEILDLLKTNQIDESRISGLMKEIDDYIYNKLELTEIEIEIIETSVELGRKNGKL